MTLRGKRRDSGQDSHKVSEIDLERKWVLLNTHAKINIVINKLRFQAHSLLVFK